jgi:CRISPR type IV-associated protein Csf3
MAKAMSPLRVELHLSEPLVRGTFPQLLDALLAYCVTQEGLALAEEDDPRPLRALARDLPLASVSGGDGRVWCASAFVPKGRVRADGTVDQLSYSGQTQCRRLTRRSDLAEFSAALERGLVKQPRFDRKRIRPFQGRLNTAGGLFKNSLLTYALKDVSCLEAWCVGDARRVRDLLERIEYVGMRRGLGHGRVRRAEVVPDARADILWQLRPLPADLAKRSAFPERFEVTMPPAAPYWCTSGAIAQKLPVESLW